MGLEYEKKKFEVLKEMFENYHRELLEDRERALDMPIETDNGFNIEREKLIEDIDEKLEIYKRHFNEPYFAKLIFEDNNDGMKFNGYIGRLSIGEVSSPSDEKIVDWRAPISDLYYNGRIGNSTYSAHGKEYSVDLKLKRQIDIKEGKVNSIFDFEEAVTNDDFLKPYLTQSADNRLKNIVSTIQEEQNKIIRLPVFQNVIVQGVAGSGKTTVALHRLSYLIYNYKKSVKPEEFLILSPNDIFMSYISNILVDLDADKSNSYSLNKLFTDILGNEYKILSKHHEYARLMKNRQPIDYLKFKNSLEFVKILERYIEYYCKNNICKDLVFKSVKILDKETMLKYFDYNKDIIVSNIITNGAKKLALALQYDEKIKKIAMSNIDNADIDIHKKFELKRKIESGNVAYLKNVKENFNIFKVYEDFIKNIEKFTDNENIDLLKKSTLGNLKKKIIAYDDLAPILYLYARFVNFPYYQKLKVVFIDEAQDLSSLMYMAFTKLFPNATFSIFGDVAQGIYSYQSIDDWSDVQNIIKESSLLYLKRSYRTTIEIMESANLTLAKLGIPPADNVVRHGEEVEYVSGNSFEIIKDEVQRLNESYSKTAIICKDDDELKVACEKLANLNMVVLDESNLNYENDKVIILTVQTAKGLEFDSVILYDENSYTESANDLKLLYVAKTRALHKLIINRQN